MKPVSIRSSYQQGRLACLAFSCLAALALSLSIYRVAFPANPPFTGRLRWLLEILSTHLGSYAVAALWLGVAVFLAFVARFIWRHTSRSPSEQLF